MAAKLGGMNPAPQSGNPLKTRLNLAAVDKTRFDDEQKKKKRKKKKKEQANRWNVAQPMAVKVKIDHHFQSTSEFVGSVDLFRRLIFKK